MESKLDSEGKGGEKMKRRGRQQRDEGGIQVQSGGEGDKKSEVKTHCENEKIREKDLNKDVTPSSVRPVAFFYPTTLIPHFTLHQLFQQNHLSVPGLLWLSAAGRGRQGREKNPKHPAELKIETKTQIQEECGAVVKQLLTFYLTTGLGGLNLFLLYNRIISCST